MNISHQIANCGKSRAEICAEAGISRSYLSLIEGNERSVGITKVHALAKALGVCAADLRPDIAEVFQTSPSDAA